MLPVINFLASDNEAQRLMFEILSQKLDLFGKVLDASDVVLHEPSSDAPEKLAGVLGNDFETRLRRIYERARTLDEITSELRRLREDIEEQRRRFEETWTRTAGLIETRFDDRVKQSFRRLQVSLPKGLERIDHELESLVTGYLLASRIPFDRKVVDSCLRLEFQSSPELPANLREGGTVVVGGGRDLDEDVLHQGHPLVEAAVEEARRASTGRFHVAWKVDAGAPATLAAAKGTCGRLVLNRIRYDGFERVDRLVPTVILQGHSGPLDLECGLWLLRQPPADAAVSIEWDEREIEDAMEEMTFLDQAEVSAREQVLFDRNIEQIERYVEDQLLGVRRRLSLESKALRAAEDRRDSALGSEARGDAEKRIAVTQKQIDELEAEIERLESRDDAEYGRWRTRAHERRYRQPEVTRILDVEFVLE